MFEEVNWFLKKFQQVTNIETWAFNLTDANLNNGKPKWFLEYKFRDFYNLNDLSPASLFDLTKEMAQNTTKLNQYWQNYVKQGDPSLKSGCNSACQIGLLCDIVTTEYNDNNVRCQQLTEIFYKNQNETSKMLEILSLKY